MFNAAPRQLPAALHEPPQYRRILEGRAKPGQRDHRRGARIQYRPNTVGETRPILDRVGRVSIEDIDADDLRPDLAKTIANVFTMRAEGESAPARCLINAITKAAP